MPHISVKLYPGKSDQQKEQLAEQIVKDVVALLETREEAVSLTIEEIEPKDWPEKVYRPDILNSSGKLYKQPGYNPFE